MLALVGCGGGGGSDGSGGNPAVTLSADVFPLAANDRRSWRVTSGTAVGSVRHERVDTTAVLTASGPAQAVRSDDGSVEYLQRSDAGVTAVPGPASDALTRAVGPLELLRFGQPAGQTVVTLDRSGISVDVDGDGRADSLDAHVESTFVGYEAVTVAAGSFSGAAHMRTVVRLTVRIAGENVSTALTTTSDDWFAPRIGQVRSLSATSGSGIATSNDAEEVYAYGVGSLRSENVAPTVVASSPRANAYALPSATVQLTVSERLDPLTLDGAGGISLVDDSGNVVPTTRTRGSAADEQWVLTPAAPLADGRYRLLTGNAVTDLANNPLPVGALPFTVDTRGPRLLSASPAAGAETAPLTGSVVFTFDEAVFSAASAGASMTLYDEGSPVALGVLPGVIQGNSVSVALTTPLRRNSGYTAELNALVDAAGNPVAFSERVIRFRTDPGPLSRPEALMAGVDVQAVTQGDINGDGRRDLVFTALPLGGGGSALVILAARLQQADGSYAAPVTLATLTPPFGLCDSRSLAMGDFDADGRADVAVGGCGFGILVLRQTAAGVFKQETAAAGSGSFHVEATDVDGDGRSEVVGVIDGFTSFGFLRRAGSGAWGPVLTVSGGSSLIANWVLADLNGDGRADLVWVRAAADNVSYELAWALRQSSGGFSAPQVKSLGELGAAGGSPPKVLVGDVSGDGRPDLVLLPQPQGNPNRLAVFRQNAAGGFDAPVTLASQYGASAAAIGDVDGDGRLDVVVAHSTLRAAGLYLQGADGTLQAERLFESGYGYFEYTDAVTLPDLNADGRADIVIRNDVLLSRAWVGAWPLQAAPRGAKASAVLTAPGPMEAAGSVRTPRGSGPLSRVLRARAR